MYSILFSNFLNKKMLIHSALKIVTYVLIMSLTMFFIVGPIINQRMFYKNHEYKGFTYYDTLRDSSKQVYNICVYETREEVYSGNTCGISYNYAKFLKLDKGDTIQLEKAGMVSDYIITEILPSKITQIYDYEIDVNCGYIAITSNSHDVVYETMDLESELSWIYKKYFLEIKDFEMYFLIMWFIIQVLFFYNVTLKSNKLYKSDYMIVTLLGLRSSEVFKIKVGVSLMSTLMPIVLGSSLAVFLYTSVFSSYLYIEFIAFIYCFWLIAYFLGGLYGCARKL